MEAAMDAAPGPELIEKFEHALTRLDQARPFAKARHQSQVLDVAARVLGTPGGPEYLYTHAAAFDRAGIFTGTDWQAPAILLPRLVRSTLEHGERTTVVIDCLSQLRMLAVAQGRDHGQGITPEQARHFLTQVLALNLDWCMGTPGESQRVRLGNLMQGVRDLYAFLLRQVGFEDILGSLIDEIWRILAQRPIQVADVREMILQIAISLADGGGAGDARLGADRLISSLFGPTQACAEDPGVALYCERLAVMDTPALQQEAYGFARAMHDVGLVSDYHAVFIDWLLRHEQAQLIPDALGLSSTGIDLLRTYQPLVQALLEQLAQPATAQSIYGLALLLERGILHMPSIAPALWRQLSPRLSEQTQSILTGTFGDAVSPQTRLLAGVIALLGQPLGIAQGNNPTCQSARALSMWSYSDPDYLLHLLSQVAGNDSIVMHFEGTALDSASLAPGGIPSIIETDPVSALLVPHLDRIYHEMGRLCAERGEDPHRWINPEFHGWWVGRSFQIAVDIGTGALQDYDQFITEFYRGYHPFYNGNQPIIHPQPAGLAVTDSAGRFVGWHAITLIRVAIDQDSVMRIYFYNPNNDSGQDWGNDVLVSIQGHGERFGEASLPFGQLASRLYIYHEEATTQHGDESVPAEEIAAVRNMALGSWAAERVPSGWMAAEQ